MFRALLPAVVGLFTLPVGASPLGDATWTFQNARRVTLHWAGTRAGVYLDDQIKINGEIFGLGARAVEPRGPALPIDDVLQPRLAFSGRRALLVTTADEVVALDQGGGVRALEFLEPPRRNVRGQIVVEPLREIVRDGESVHVVFVPWRDPVARGPIAFAGEAWAIRDDGTAVRFALTTDVDPPGEVTVDDGIVRLKGYPRGLDLDHFAAEASVATGFARTFSDGRSLENSGWQRAREIFSTVPRARATEVTGAERTRDRATAALTVGRRSVVLTGPPGVGKAHLARAIVAGLPRTWTIFDVTPDGFNSVSGASGAFDARLLAMKAAAESRPVVWLLRDFAGFDRLGVNVQKSTDFFDGLTREMNDGLIRVLGLASDATYAGVVQSRDALAQSIDRVRVHEADDRETVSVVARAVIEANVTIEAEIFVALREWGRRFTPNVAEPGRTVQLVKLATHNARARGGGAVGWDDAMSAVETRAGIPREFVDHERAVAKLAALGAELARLHPGNEDARAHLVDAARATLFQLTDLDRPRATGLLLGPPGAGKTTLIKAYADLMNLPFEAIPMSTFARDWDVDAFLKTAGEFARAHPHGVVFLDEFDEAAPKVQNALLGAMESNVLRRPGANGLEPVSIGNLQIFAAANAGAELVTQAAARGGRVNEVALVGAAAGAISKKMLDRFDFVGAMYPADARGYRAIVQLQVERALAHLSINPEQIVDYAGMIEEIAARRPHAESSHRDGERAVDRAIRAPIGALLGAGALAGPRASRTARFRFDGILRLDCEENLAPADGTVVPFRPR